jgi:hypothetical protein
VIISTLTIQENQMIIRAIQISALAFLVELIALGKAFGTWPARI